MNKRAPGQNAYLLLHLSVVLWGFTAILGKLIEMREFMLVWYRLLFTAIILALLPGVVKLIKHTERKQLFIFAGIGMLVALHWVCFYGSIKYANASVALSTLATSSILTAIIEPLITGKKIRRYELLLGAAVIPGILLVSSTLPGKFNTGAILGMLAAILAAIFTSLNKKHTTTADPKLVTFIELGAGFLFLSALLPIYIKGFHFPFQVPSAADLRWLIVLSLICTALPYIMWLKALRAVSAFAANLTNNLEPVYGIILAAIIFQEDKELDKYFYIGTGLIMLTVFLQPLISRLRPELRSLDN